MWKLTLFVGPAATTQKRVVSPGSAVSGCVTYWFAYPLNVTQSAIRERAFVMSSEAGSSTPGLDRYHSLPTRTYSLSTAGSPSPGSTMLAPYTPLALSAATPSAPHGHLWTPRSPAPT